MVTETRPLLPVPRPSLPATRPGVRGTPLQRAAWRALVALAACAWLPAAADIYSCRTEKGSTFTGDVPPPQCKRLEMRVLNPDGSLKRIIPAPLSKEEIKQRHDEEEARLKAEEEAHAQAARDRALLDTYTTAEEIEGARNRALASQNNLLKRATERIAQLQKERKHLDDEAEFYAKRALPGKLKEQFQTNATLMKQQDDQVEVIRQEIDRINSRYDGERRRFLELQGMAEKAMAERKRRADESAAEEQRAE